MHHWERELEVAVYAARQAASLAQKYQAGIEVELKADESPVTKADRECERLVASVLMEAFPDDGLFGEEGTRSESKSGRTWIIDPIDGTRDYIRGNHLWANLIGLEVKDDITVGVVNLPMMDSLYAGIRGGGSYLNDTPIHVSSKRDIRESVLCFCAFNKLDSVPFEAVFLDWMAQFWAVRGLGGASDAMMVASGQAEVFIEPRAEAWDFAPLKIIVEEAGGMYFNFDGGSRIRAGNCVTCAPGLEAEIKNLLGLSHN